MEVSSLNLELGRLGSFLAIQDLMVRRTLQNLSQSPAFSAVSTAVCFSPTGSFLQLSIHTLSAARVLLILRYIPVKMDKRQTNFASLWRNFVENMCKSY